MSQISRPFQIAIGAVLVLGLLWFVALRPKSQSATTTPPAPAPRPAAVPPRPLNAKTPVVGGLFGAVNKARGAVATSSANANQLEQQSNAASSSNPQSATSAPQVSATAPPGTQTQAGTATHAGSVVQHPGGAAASTSGDPVQKIKAELANNKTVALLFWNPLATDDQAVRRALQSLIKHERKNGPLVAVYATPGQVTQFGTIVNVSQVLQTPALLIMVGSHVEAVTDLQDAADLRQYIGDVDQGGPGQKLLPHLTAYAKGTTPVGPTRLQYVTRANAACRAANKHHPAPPDLRTAKNLQQALHELVTYLQAELNAIDRIPKPKADVGYLATVFTNMRRADQEIVQSLAARTESEKHSLVLSAETNANYASNGAANYGLLDCVAPDSLSQR
jgi:hypothetical protein